MDLTMLTKAIENYIAETKYRKEDIELKMGMRFYNIFFQACQDKANFTVSGITHFEGIKIDRTHYMPMDKCIIVNMEMLYKNHSNAFNDGVTTFELGKE